VLTLIQVPVMVSLADSFRDWLKRVFKAGSHDE